MEKNSNSKLSIINIDLFATIEASVILASHFTVWVVVAWVAVVWVVTLGGSSIGETSPTEKLEKTL